MRACASLRAGYCDGAALADTAGKASAPFLAAAVRLEAMSRAVFAVLLVFARWPSVAGSTPLPAPAHPCFLLSSPGPPYIWRPALRIVDITGSTRYCSGVWLAPSIYTSADMPACSLMPRAALRDPSLAATSTLK
ncbi:MAG: hypothetical protein JWQ80_2881 [Massilia sp.]|nr:hypothetical protein [Massilia sp.]